MAKEKVVFPGWRYGPKGEAEIFQTADEVPEGWTDNPNDFNKTAKAEPRQNGGGTPTPTPPPTPSKYDGWDKAKLVAEIEGRKPKITFNKNWPEKKLIQLLEADDKKKA